jgi:hypothetical protein
MLFLWGGTYCFGCGEIRNEGRLKGWALKVETFLGPKMAAKTITVIAVVCRCSYGTRLAPCHFRDQKALISGPTPSNGPRNGASKSLRPAITPYKQQVH